MALVKTLGAGLRFLPVLARHYDVVHVHFVGPMLYIARFYKLLHPRSKLVLTVHGSGLALRPEVAQRITRRYAASAAKVDYLIAAGKALTPRIRAQLDRKPDETLCAGIDGSVFAQLDGEPRPKEYDFIFVGSFAWLKGVDIFLEALEKLRDDDISVCFVGNGPMLKVIQTASHDSNIRIFTDVSPRKLCELYSAARFLVFPSRGDGFGLVVTEAMYCGTPAIVYANSGAKEQVRHNFNGLVYKTNTADKLAKALRDAFELPAEAYQSLAANALTSNEHYDLQATGERLFAIYRDLTAGRQP